MCLQCKPIMTARVVMVELAEPAVTAEEGVVEISHGCHLGKYVITGDLDSVDRPL